MVSGPARLTFSAKFHGGNLDRLMPSVRVLCRVQALVAEECSNFYFGMPDHDGRLPPISDFVTTSEGPTPRFSSPGNEGYCTGAINDDFEIPADLFFLETDQAQGFYVSVAFYLEGFDADCTSAGPVDAYIKRVDFGFGTR